MYIFNNTHFLYDSCGGRGSSCGSSNGCGSSSKGEKDITTPLELHACMGLNACKGHDRFGTNACAGQGFCATQTHVCHTLNNCRGQGGCGLYGDASEQCRPGANDCAWQGSCATPIQAERFSTQGPNAGKSTWLLARKLFEERMAKANRTVGPSPFPSGPPQKWLQSVAANGEYDSCGNSGDKYCSFGYNSPAKNAEEMIEASREALKDTCTECKKVEEDEQRESQAQQ